MMSGCYRGISRGKGYLAQISSFCSTAFEIAELKKNCYELGQVSMY